jgi:tetratricopeptide (TPR) repeat protein
MTAVRSSMPSWKSIPVILLLAACSSPGPSDPAGAFRHEGEAALAEGDTEKAVVSYQLALAVSPGDPQALRGLLAAQQAHGEGEAALVTLAALRASSDEPLDPCPVLELAGRARLSRGDPEGAEVLGRRSVSQGCARGGSLLAAALTGVAERRASSDAAEQYLEAIAHDPDDPARYAAAAELFVSLGRVGDAVALLAEGLERHPDDRRLRDQMVRALAMR